MKKFKVNVTNSGVIILPHNGKKVRTPVELIVKEDKLEEYKIQFRSKGLIYTIEEFDKVIEENINQKPIVPKMTKKVIVEDIEDITTIPKPPAEPTSFLDKLISDSED